MRSPPGSRNLRGTLRSCCSLQCYSTTAGDADGRRSIDVDALLKESSAEVVSLIGVETETDKRVTSSLNNILSRRIWMGLAASLLLALFFSVSMLVIGGREFAQPDARPLVVVTTLGEQRTVMLEDGSAIYVNTLSELRVDYDDAFRTVELVSGEALFNVEKDPTRPFRVIAGDTVSVALGTTFNVRFIDNVAEVAVVEGVVAVEKKGVVDTIETGAQTSEQDIGSVGRIDGARVILEAGEEVVLSPAATTPRLAAVNVEAVSSWRKRRLSFDNDPLSDITEEFNRYNRKRLVVLDGNIGQQRFTGVFAADDPASFVTFLEQTGAVQSFAVGSEIHLRAAR